MFEIPLLLILIIIIALIFDFTNGAHDCANAIATVISTKALTPQTAVLMAAVLNLLGAFLGTEVASTLGKGIVNTEVVSGNQILVLAALSGAITWNFITWYYGIPSSSSHALIGGLIGSSIISAGFTSLNILSILQKIILPLFLAPLLGFFTGFSFMTLLSFLFAKTHRKKLTKKFTHLQILSAAFMATSHALNDAQKTMGVITLALFIFNKIESITVPFWVKVVCAIAMAAGTAVGGWKIIKTMGNSIFKLEPVHGFAAETSASAVITIASILGAPISTTHTITACIFGVGSTKRLSAVRWFVAITLVKAWMITIPASAIIGIAFFYFFSFIGLSN
ncbi:inorganic phosphate transporter [Lawsonia intracellularis]|uniref:Phosphate/sulphate permeases n=1 Tax=Lawsonia intracellularis (strain PHE/MN1-00) TaxID=363253 RepID=Q1MQ62_LAWIP|nr:inorganic phosphate transporter [Lawsonia intracellularis]AGC50236.1 phosphate transporter family protein [Lawsonia intracellularis N343]KAA0204663.1 inorganic phosphate transporter [Lawsonia intracellularis]MBZ3892677.1 inorganic phosphate transporter [Lawsonia intracellularis]RBN33156.1 inorganic phosphate transporter [Lawsonia intracellularis]RBN35720.1 inorganic phosphate transporter [Lawsonia intracellularis]